MGRPAELPSIVPGPDAGLVNGASVRNGRPSAEPAGGGAADIYAEKWAAAGVDGGLYVGRSRASGTPLLDRLIDRLPSPNGRPHQVVEAAAGSGDQAIYLATRLRRTIVTAIDTSPHATAQIEQRRQDHKEELADGSKITVVTGDVLSYLSRQEPGTVDAFHANSFWHFLTDAEQAEQMAALREAQTPSGLVAVSFKAEGDGLLSEPGTQTVGRNREGVHAVPADGIQRIFVTNPEAVAERFEDGGLRVVDIVEFGIPDYDVPGKDGRFVGILAQNAA